MNNKRFYFQEVDINNKNIIIIEKNAPKGIRFNPTGKGSDTYFDFYFWMERSQNSDWLVRLTRKQAEGLKYKGFRKFLREKN